MTRLNLRTLRSVQWLLFQLLDLLLVVLQQLQQLWQGAPIPAGVAVGLKVVAVHSRPQRLLRLKDPQHRLYKTSKPDGDNVLKIAADSCNGICWHDDAQVAVMQVQTLYAAKGETACVELSIYELEPCQM